jgi:hypothetical protein
MALEALAHHHAASGMLRALLSAVLPMGRGSEQQRHAGERGTDISPDDHCVSLQAFLVEPRSCCFNRFDAGFASANILP